MGLIQITILMRKKNMNWIKVPLGAKLSHKLPVTIDSIRANHFENTTSFDGENWYISKGLNDYYGSLRNRIYHAYLVLTNKAVAVQFTEDHIKLYHQSSKK